MASSITIIISPASHHQSIQCRCSICKMSHCLFLWINCSQTAISIILFEQNKSPPPSSFIQVATVSQYNKRSSRCRFAKNTLSTIDPINYHTEDTLIDHHPSLTGCQCYATRHHRRGLLGKMLNSMQSCPCHAMRNSNSFIHLSSLASFRHRQTPRFKSQSRFSHHW